MLDKLQQWQPPADWLQLQTLDCHTGGEPLRIIIAGYPSPKGTTVLAKRDDCLARLDQFRQLLMFEPRGHADMYGVLLTAPERPDSLFGAIFMHNEGYSSMCGHATLALAKVAVQCGLVQPVAPVTQFYIDVPAGQLSVYAELSQQGSGVRVERVWFDNVPSFMPRPELGLGAGFQPASPLHGLQARPDGQPAMLTVTLPDGQSVPYQLGYGGAYYAYVPADAIGLSLTPDNHSAIIAAGRAIKQAVAAQISLQHPTATELAFLYGTIFYQPLAPFYQPLAPFYQPSVSVTQPLASAAPQLADEPAAIRRYRNVCVFADGELDRSPTGSGVAGFAAILQQKGELQPGELLQVHSIIDSVFTVEIRQLLDVQGMPAVIARVSGEAYITGRHQFWLDPSDPFPAGFLLR